MPREMRYLIRCERMRPLGRLNFAARPVYQSDLPEQESAETPPRTEHWGETEEDAMAKVRAAVQTWAERVGVSLVGV